MSNATASSGIQLYIKYNVRGTMFGHKVMLRNRFEKRVSILRQPDPPPGYIFPTMWCYSNQQSLECQSLVLEFILVSGNVPAPLPFQLIPTMPDMPFPDPNMRRCRRDIRVIPSPPLRTGFGSQNMRFYHDCTLLLFSLFLLHENGLQFLRKRHY